MARTYDAIVIGGGVIGASTAFHLAKAGVGRIALVERRTICSGNTRKSGAIVRMHYSNDPEARLALASLPYFQHWSELVGGTCGFRPTGFAILVGPENLERLERNVTRLRALGADTKVVSPAELREVMPALQTDGVAAAAYEPTGGYADAVMTTRSFAEAAQRLGVEVLEGTPVTALEGSGGRITGLQANGELLSAPVVICAANTWSPGLLRTIGVELAVTPRRAQTAYFERPGEYAGPHPVVLDTTTALYTRAHGDDQILGGAADETGTSPSDPDQYDETADREFPGAVSARMGRRLPSLANLTLVRGEAGLYDMSPDTRAIIDAAPGVAGLYLAAGFSGTGFKKAPAVGLGLAELVTAGRATSVDLAPFHFSRFAEDDPIHGPDEYVLPRSWGHSF
ncbi:MAG TPA: FAD-binding oxidoreductase [Chloroflexota bacterium]|nr:FAD-binding oxidoreductase [Chloroflexota bacterium]